MLHASGSRNGSRLVGAHDGKNLALWLEARGIPSLGPAPSSPRRLGVADSTRRGLRGAGSARRCPTILSQCWVQQSSVESRGFAQRISIRQTMGVLYMDLPST